MRKLVLTVATLLLAAACGGAQATPSPTPLPTATPQAANPVQTAVAALKQNHDSWQYTATTYESGTPNFSRTVTGTEITRPAIASSFTVTESGKPDLRYVRIGTDVWSDTGAGSYSTSKTSDNYVNQAFGQFYLANIVSAAEAQGFEFNSVGSETVNGIAATHYRLTDDDIAGIIADMPGLTADDWGADIWTADSDGSLLRLAWGPQSVELAQDQTGFNYEVTALDCACPVTPPNSTGS